MAKFNKDIFLNTIEDNVKDAIKNGLITKEDIKGNDEERLRGFIRYKITDILTEEDRKYLIDVLKDFNYDERYSWEKLQSDFGTFKSIEDISVINLWKFLESEGLTSYSYYLAPHIDKEDLPDEDDSVLHDNDDEDDDFSDEEVSDKDMGDEDDDFEDDDFDNKESIEPSDDEEEEDEDHEDKSIINSRFRRF